MSLFKMTHFDEFELISCKYITSVDNMSELEKMLYRKLDHLDPENFFIPEVKTVYKPFDKEHSTNYLLIHIWVWSGEEPYEIIDIYNSQNRGIIGFRTFDEETIRVLCHRVSQF